MNFTIIRPTSVLSSTDLRHLPAPRHCRCCRVVGFFLSWPQATLKLTPPPHVCGIRMASLWHPCVGIRVASLRHPCVFLRHPCVFLACSCWHVPYLQLGILVFLPLWPAPASRAGIARSIRLPITHSPAKKRGAPMPPSKV